MYFNSNSIDDGSWVSNSQEVGIDSGLVLSRREAITWISIDHTYPTVDQYLSYISYNGVRDTGIAVNEAHVMQKYFSYIVLLITYRYCRFRLILLNQ